VTKQPPLDLEHMTKKSRRRACELLGLDPEKLSPGDTILADRVGQLRVIVSDMQDANLRGEPIDLPRYLVASEALETIVRAGRQQITPEGIPFSLESARRKMAALLCVDMDTGKDTREPDWQAQIAQLQAENCELKTQLAARPVAEEPKPAAPKSPGHPPGHNVVVPMRSFSGDEPWRRHLSPTGEIITGGREGICIAPGAGGIDLSKL
jgi:hypothetical protein